MHSWYERPLVSLWRTSDSLPAYSVLYCVEQEPIHHHPACHTLPLRYRLVPSPLLLSLSSNAPRISALGAAAVSGYATLDATQTFYIRRQSIITLGFFVATMAANGLCTCSYILCSLSRTPNDWMLGLLAFKIWTTQRTTSKLVQIVQVRKRSSLGKVMAVVLESGTSLNILLAISSLNHVRRSNLLNKFASSGYNLCFAEHCCVQHLSGSCEFFAFRLRLLKLTDDPDLSSYRM
jgi:hypothetical protein